MSGSSISSSFYVTTKETSQENIRVKLAGYLPQTSKKRPAVTSSNNPAKNVSLKTVPSNRTRRRRVSLSPERTSSKMIKLKGAVIEKTGSPARKPRKVVIETKEKISGKLRAADSVQEANMANKTSSLYMTVALSLSKLRLRRSYVNYREVGRLQTHSASRVPIHESARERLPLLQREKKLRPLPIRGRPILFYVLFCFYILFYLFIF